MRVVSLLPSATELLCAIGGEHLLVGRSHECDFPASITRLPALTASRTHFQSAAQVDRDVRALLAPPSTEAGPSTADPALPADGSSLYTLDRARLRDLRPDVILTQDLCRVCSIDLRTVERLARELPGPPRVVSLNPTTFEAVFDDLLTVGEAVGLLDGARRTMVALRERVYRAADFANPFIDGPNVAFLEWTDPLFIGGHWTPQLIERAGGRHPLNPTEPIRPASLSVGAAAGPVGTTQRRAGPSVSVPRQVLLASRPEMLIICPCGLTLEQTRAEAASLSGLIADLAAAGDGNQTRDGTDGRGGLRRVALVDGNQMFNRPGPRLVDALEWLTGWLNDRPEVIPADFPWSPWPI